MFAWKRTLQDELKTISLTWEEAKKAAKDERDETSGQGPMFRGKNMK